MQVRLIMLLAALLCACACSSAGATTDQPDDLAMRRDAGPPPAAEQPDTFEPAVDPCDAGTLPPVLCFDEDAARCAPGACNIDGVCYPSGAVTEDGCCSCRDGASKCLDIPACPSSRLIGRRCVDDRDCSFPGTLSGLVCRLELLASPAAGSFRRGTCTRTCNDGCPRGTECIASLRAAVTVPFDAPVCMRVCDEQRDCQRNVGGQPLGSWCTAYEGRYGWYCN